MDGQGLESHPLRGLSHVSPRFVAAGACGPPVNKSLAPGGPSPDRSSEARPPITGKTARNRSPDQGWTERPIEAIAEP